MKKYILLTLFFATAACTSSVKKSNPESSSIEVDIDNLYELRCSDVFDTIEYVPLETTDSFLLGYTDKMILLKNIVYFVSGKAVSSFDAVTGRGLLKLSKLGHGPNEYQSIFDIYADTISGNIEVLDNNGKKIMVYDRNGLFMHSISIPFASFSFLKEDNKRYWFYNNNWKTGQTDFKMVYYDVDKQNILEEYFPIDNHIAQYFFVSDKTVFERTPQRMLCYFAPSDTIYEYQKNKGFIPAISINFREHKTPVDFFKEDYNDIMEFSEAAKKNDYVYALSNFAVNDKNDVLFSFRLDRTTFWTLAFPYNSKARTITSFVDDFHSTALITLDYNNTSYVMNNDYLYFLITGEQFITLSEKEKEGTAILKKMVEEKEISEQSNPILVKCKLKE